MFLHLRRGSLTSKKLDFLLISLIRARIMPFLGKTASVWVLHNEVLFFFSILPQTLESIKFSLICYHQQNGICLIYFHQINFSWQSNLLHATWT